MLHLCYKIDTLFRITEFFIISSVVYYLRDLWILQEEKTFQKQGKNIICLKLFASTNVFIKHAMHLVSRIFMETPLVDNFNMALCYFLTSKVSKTFNSGVYQKLKMCAKFDLK